VREMLLIIASATLGSCGQLLLKRGMTSFGATSVGAIWGQLGRVLIVPEVVVGFLSFGVGAILWLVVVSKAEISYAYPISSGISYAILLFVASAWLGEGVTWVRIGGVLLILAGLVMITRS
jgi:multidrug transporter EmrE-like cation transporter